MINSATPWAWENFTWTELNGNTNSYPVYLNRETNEYFDGDRIALITAKCAELIFARPLHTACKTAYHLLALRNPSTALKHLADVVRTPIYGILLTALAIVGLVLGLFGSDKIYDLRLLMGKIEQSLNWGEKQTSWTLAPCFQPEVLDKINETWGVQDFSKDTLYENGERGKSNYARAKIIHKRRFSCPLLQDQVQTLPVS